MTALRPGLPPLPLRMRTLRVDARGYPVPWFVQWINGVPDFRVADSEKIGRALRFGCCWICGDEVGKWKSFVIGPMCAVNRTTSEPPCHWECAEYAVTACPFLTLPKAKRRDGNLPEGVNDPPGMMVPRNPGVSCIWTTLSYSLFNAGNGSLLRLGPPARVQFFKETRRATRAEVLESIDSGLLILRKEAQLEGPDALAALDAAYAEMLPLLPGE